MYSELRDNGAILGEKVCTLTRECVCVSKEEGKLENGYRVKMKEKKAEQSSCVLLGEKSKNFTYS